MRTFLYHFNINFCVNKISKPFFLINEMKMIWIRQFCYFFFNPVCCLFKDSMQRQNNTRNCSGLVKKCTYKQTHNQQKALASYCPLLHGIVVAFTVLIVSVVLLSYCYIGMRLATDEDDDVQQRPP